MRRLGTASLVAAVGILVFVGCSAAEEENAEVTEQGAEETDVGCGGKNAPPCPESRGCKVDLDCMSGNCDGAKCGPPVAGKTPNVGCQKNEDCASKNCVANECKPAAPDDGVKNDDESDVDCGGTKAPKCVAGKTCGTKDDCESGVCKDGTCAAPSPTDGVKNGTETDVDCGGANAPKCDVGKTCAVHEDCASDGCAYDKKCAIARSCTQHHGGDTCGSGEVGQPGAQHESCCASVPIAGGRKLDKYSITAGRMRAFIERFNGDIRSFVASLGNNPDWQQAWNSQMPTSMTDAYYEMGPYGITNNQRQGCYLKGQGARTYWLPDNINTSMFGDEIAQKYDKDTLDAKALQCVTFYMLQAFCIWDGGRLATIGELDAQWNGTYPWGGQAWDASLAVHKFTYGWPENRLDNTAYIAAPGRKPAGNGKGGVADLGGLVFNMTSTFDGQGNVRWSRNGSWENHRIPYGVHHSPKARAYWATGGRCTRY